MNRQIARLRIELQELEPKIWRRIDMPLSTNLEALHEAIQITMGWTFSHLWEFEINGRSYGDPSPDDQPVMYRAKSLPLGTVIASGAARFVYVYDFGDYWRHDVIVEEVRDGDPAIDYPACVDGERCCPPEDVGGPEGFMDFLEAILDPCHEEHRAKLEWHGGPFNLTAFNKASARIGLETIALRRGPLASYGSRLRRTHA